MFTGIIKDVGRVESYDQNTFVLKVRCPLFKKEQPTLGASIAIDGICLSASHLDEMPSDIVGFDLGLETRVITLLHQKKPGEEVNVEFSLALGDRLDGHLVQGHVDGIVEVLSLTSIETSGLLMKFSLPKKFTHLVVKKGAIAINGVSLTVNDVDDSGFLVCIVPHTMEKTCFKNYQPGDFVHIETDIIGRYLEKLTFNYALKQ